MGLALEERRLCWIWLLHVSLQFTTHASKRALKVVDVHVLKWLQSQT